MTILFPSAYGDITKIDPDLQSEYKAVCDTGLYNIMLFDYEKWFHLGQLKIIEIKTVDSNNTNPVIYRGWMMKPEQYKNFYIKCRDYDIWLITTPEEYEAFHIYPNIYPKLKQDAVSMLTFPLHAQIDVSKVGKQLGRFMVKDYVKSVKGTDFPTYFEPTISQIDFNTQMEKFYQYRGNLLTGGIICKSFVRLRKYNGQPNEFRIFYVNGIPICISRNSNQPLFSKEPPNDLINKYSNLNSPFYTIDIAELEDNNWIIIEAGDGQVSGPSPEQNLIQFYRYIWIALKNRNHEYPLQEKCEA